MDYASKPPFDAGSPQGAGPEVVARFERFIAGLDAHLRHAVSRVLAQRAAGVHGPQDHLEVPACVPAAGATVGRSSALEGGREREGARERSRGRHQFAAVRCAGPCRTTSRQPQRRRDGRRRVLLLTVSRERGRRRPPGRRRPAYREPLGSSPAVYPTRPCNPAPRGFGDASDRRQIDGVTPARSTGCGLADHDPQGRTDGADRGVEPHRREGTGQLVPWVRGAAFLGSRRYPVCPALVMAAPWRRPSLRLRRVMWASTALLGAMLRTCGSVPREGARRAYLPSD